jgi:phosphonate transport system substrate-binding protein
MSPPRHWSRRPVQAWVSPLARPWRPIIPLIAGLIVGAIGAAFPFGSALAQATVDDPRSEAGAEDIPPSITFGIVPQQSAGKLAQNWAPVLAYLGAHSGTDLKFRTARDIPEFERRVAAGDYDIAYMNPYHYTVFSGDPGYRAFVKAANQPIRGILVVRADSPTQSPAELADATIAFPAPAAFAASVLTRAYLTRANIAFTPKYVASHDSVYRAVAKGLYPAGGGVIRTLDSVAPDIRAQLRVLWTSEGYTPHAFAAHPRVPAAVVARLTRAMVDMGDTDTGRALLAPLSIGGFESATDSDWDDVRLLGIDLLRDLNQPAP